MQGPTFVPSHTVHGVHANSTLTTCTGSEPALCGNVSVALVLHIYRSSAFQGKMSRGRLRLRTGRIQLPRVQQRHQPAVGEVSLCICRLSESQGRSSGTFWTTMSAQFGAAVAFLPILARSTSVRTYFNTILI